jgi:hypothetical protein
MIALIILTAIILLLLFVLGKQKAQIDWFVAHFMTLDEFRERIELRAKAKYGKDLTQNAAKAAGEER